MILLCFSDTHSRPQRMIRAVRAETGAAACFFLGDGANEPDELRGTFPNMPLYSVRGNCDFASHEPAEGLAPFGGLLVYYTHGHGHFVKQDLDGLWAAAKARHADIALFGHTHFPYYEERGGIHLFNPGSVSLPRTGSPSYGRITIDGGAASFEIVRVP